MATFICGLFIGVFIGVVFLALLQAGRTRDDEWEEE